ncbi:MAG: hypothetical protein QOI63_885 [Thermoplasmata archaeon]|jgi:hypothetical protein|nr:hypothetical protein [Thermoplasmata archaeon]
MRVILLAALLLAATLAVAVPATAVYCHVPSGGGIVGEVVAHASDQCDRILNTILRGNDIVRNLLDAIDATCVFVTGSPCIP